MVFYTSVFIKVRKSSRENIINKGNEIIKYKQKEKNKFLKQ